MDPITRARINDSIRDVLAGLLATEMQDPRLVGVTVTAVEVTPDLLTATVYFSVLGDEDKRERAAQGLRHVAGYFRREVSRRLRLRTAPELGFEFDASLEHGQRIETLLREWHEERERGTAGDSADAGDAGDGDR